MDSSIKFNVSANTAQFQSGMRQVDTVAKGTAAGIKSAFAGVGAMLVGGAMVSGLRSLMNDFDRVGKLATRFGTSAESIQRVGVAAQVAGTDVEAVANAMTKAGIAASKAVEQGGTMAEMFQRAGINARDFAAANIDQKLLMIAEAYRAAGNDASKTNAIIEIMGSRAGANLIPLISNLEGLKEEMAAVAVASDETVKRIEAANDTMTRSGNTIKVYFAEALAFYAQTAERIGALMAGVGPVTVSEMEREQDLANAKNRLSQQGQLITDEEGQPIEAPKDFLSAMGQTKEEMEKVRENQKRISEEADRYKKELKESEAATKRNALASEEVTDKLAGQREQKGKILELGLQIKEAEAAGNTALADKLRYQEDIEKGILKYKDAEDSYGMAVREANAELAKRNKILDEAGNRMVSGATATESERQRSSEYSSYSDDDYQKAHDEYVSLSGRTPQNTDPEEYEKIEERRQRAQDVMSRSRRLAQLDSEVPKHIRDMSPEDRKRLGVEDPNNLPTPDGLQKQPRRRGGATASERASASEDKTASESTLQKVVRLMEELNTKLPQPVLS